MIRPVQPGDIPRLCEIYNPYVTTSTITFEESPVSIATMTARVDEVLTNLPWLVDEGPDGTLRGYAYASKWKGRCAYRFTAEPTIYLAPECTGQGVGTQLYRELLSNLRARGLRSALAQIALPNPASVALHERLGFSKAGHLAQVGFKFGNWIDVGIWQLDLTQP